MRENACMICREPERARLIEADWAGGMSGSGISKRMTAAGWPVGPETVLSHLKKHVPLASTRQNTPAGSSKRDAAVFIKDRILDEVELRERAFRMALEQAGDDEDLIAQAMKNRPNILDKDLQSALGTALKAEAVIVKRDDNKVKRGIDLYKMMLGGGDGAAMFAPAGLIGDGSIEADFREVSTEEDNEED